MSTPFSTNNPGIGGIDELTSEEEAIIASIASLGTAGQLLAVNAGATGVEWVTAGGVGDMLIATYDTAGVSADAFTMTNMNGGNWKVFYTNGTGDVTELALGTSGQVLTSNGATSAPTFENPSAGSGTVDTSGTPVANDFARFTDADTIEGRSYSEVRSDLGLVIGTNVQAHDAQLDSIAAIVPGVEGNMITSDGLGGYQITTAAGVRTYLNVANGAEANTVDSVNTKTGAVVIDPDDLNDTSTTNKFTTAGDISKLAGIEALADVTDATNVGSSMTGATAKTTPVDADTMPLNDSAASNVLKKVTWANIKATLKTYFDTLYLSLAGGTMTGDLLLGENSLELDGALSATDKWSGVTVSGTAGTTVAFGDALYIAVADSRWELVDASAASTSGSVPVLLALGASTDGSAVELLVQGIVRDTAWSWTVGGPIYLSETGTTGNTLTQTAPTTTDSVTKVVGYAISATEMVWNPSVDYLTHV